ncbi:hypothetical protein H8B02_32710 [Bradyrhizobium sp. Pear77]|uniref:hypothetical protein n=1 Tax=Bradyrhizobium TaxID=374 RepID=UPI001E3F5AE7|nr:MULTISPECIES: hypothetical protein [Bradyrhizobium]MCC8958019.1 hypothetical protein [Bradyrhizobium altum]MCC8967122.1 hypothetical protein [Bradyrhizobium oropedii]
MNIDPPDTAEDFIEAYDLRRQQQAQPQPGGLSAQTGSPAHPPPDQANFEQQLSELRPIHRASDSAAALMDSRIGLPSTMTTGNLRACAIEESERCPVASFVRGRAELAASLTGANVKALKSEINLAAQRAAQWPRTTESSAGNVDGDRIFDDAVALSYLPLHRFQNEDIDCEHLLDKEVSAIAHVRSLADLRAHASPHVSKAAICSDDEREDEIDMARLAAWHTQGLTDSAFVSLSQDPSRLRLSKDHSENGANAIAKNARKLHTYTVPSVTAWPIKKINDILERGHAPGDKELRDWVGGIPTEETEVLFLGGNLADYRTASVDNPNAADAPQDGPPIKKARVSSDTPEMMPDSRTHCHSDSISSADQLSTLVESAGMARRLSVGTQRGQIRSARNPDQTHDDGRTAPH